jgi:hypothetical protein
LKWFIIKIKKSIDQRGKEYTNQHKSKSNSLMFANSRNSKTPPTFAIVGNGQKKFVIKYAPKKVSLLESMEPSLPSHDYLIYDTKFLFNNGIL